MTTFTITAEHLTQYVSRVEHLEEEKKSIAENIKEVFAEAKGDGFDVKALKEIIRIRKIEAGELEELECLLDIYRRALGMLPELD